MNEIPKKSNNPGEHAAYGMLPPSGLAEEILKQEESSAVPDEALKTDMSTGPDRIYAFADRLKESQKKDEAGKVEDKFETWVTFALNTESFGLPVSNVQEILRVSTITKVPHAPEPVRGITNMRGRVLPVVDLRVRLGIKEAEISDSSRILVVESWGRLIGLLVDSVQQVVRLSRNGVKSLPPDVMTVQSDYVLGIYHLQDSLVILLNVDRLLLIKDSLQVVEQHAA